MEIDIIKFYKSCARFIIITEFCKSIFMFNSIILNLYLFKKFTLKIFLIF
jgi:hypothetical protein